MKNIFSTFIILIFFLNSSTFYVNANEDNSSPYSLQSGYKLFNERITNVCNQYKPEKELLTIKDEYEEINWNYSFETLKKRYKKNMNNVYKCALIITQKNSLTLIKKDLINKNPLLLDRVWQKIDSEMDKLDVINSTLWCTQSNEESSIIKLNVLQQYTYETCKYLAYLEYLKEIDKNGFKSILPEQQEDYAIWNIISTIRQRDKEISDEIEHTYKVFPMAFHAYTEYENNITIHFLLELIKDDYLIIKEKLHEVLNPINQVVYKISNAMKK